MQIKSANIFAHMCSLHVASVSAQQELAHTIAYAHPCLIFLVVPALLSAVSFSPPPITPTTFLLPNMSHTKQTAKKTTGIKAEHKRLVPLEGAIESGELGHKCAHTKESNTVEQHPVSSVPPSALDLF